MLSVGVVLLQFMKRIWSEFKLIARFPWMSPMSNQLPKKKGHTWTPFGIHCIDVCVRIRPNPFKTTPLKNTWVCFSVPIINMEQKKNTHTAGWRFFSGQKSPCFLSCLCFGGRNLEIFGLHHYLRGPHEEAKGFPRRGRGKASKISKMFFGWSEAWSWYWSSTSGRFLFTDAHSTTLCQFDL